MRLIVYQRVKQQGINGKILASSYVFAGFISENTIAGNLLQVNKKQ